MEITSGISPLPHVLVSDFDGTMTRHDFYKLALQLLIPPDVPNYWEQYRAGSITHFEALRSYFATIHASEDKVLAVVEQMELDPHLANAVNKLAGAGWRVIVASAGCDWYIKHHLEQAGIDIEVHSNPGRYEPGKGLLMQQPRDSKFWSPTLGVDKTGVVRHFLNAGRTVAFAGDGFPDADPARLVPDDLRFARGDLADVLRKEGLPFQPYDSWSEIADDLVRRTT